jgi:hypothetical protein
MGPSEAIRSALFDALGQTGLNVHSVAPQAADGGSAASFPYAHIGAIVMAEWDTDTTTGHNFTARIHSRWRGMSQTPGAQMQDTIYQFLHLSTLAIDNGLNVLFRRTGSTVLQLPDHSWDGVDDYSGLIVNT